MGLLRSALCLFALGVLPSMNALGDAGKEVSAASNHKTYSNPVYPFDTADPTVERGLDGRFYASGTTGGWGRLSDDMVTWYETGNMLADVNGPWWGGYGGLWAPDITRVGNKYLMYYAHSQWMGDLWNKTGVGVMESGKIDGPYIDRGKLFMSNEIGVWNSIDPHLFVEDDGRMFLSWGSYGGGLWTIELSPDGLSLKPGAQKVQIAGDGFEGCLVHKHNGFYYLFASTGTCCNGLNSTYTTVVGRSKSIFGPYVDRAGGRMLDNKFHILISNNRYFKGTAHNAEILTDDNGDDWIYYHSYCEWVPDNGRVLMMDRVRWIDDWPVINNGYPAYYQTAAPIVRDRSKEPSLRVSKECVHITAAYNDRGRDEVEFVTSNLSGGVSVRVEGDDAELFDLSAPSFEGCATIGISYSPTGISEHRATLVAEADGVAPLRIPIEARATNDRSYSNPVFHLDTADPSVERGEDGRYYAFCTGGWGRWSEDLIEWHDNYGMLADMNGPKWGGYDGF